MVANKEVKKIIQKYIYGRNRTHYLKWKLDNANDWSIRFFFNFDSRTQYNKQWVLKSHKEKHYIIITRKEAVDYIRKYSKVLQPEEIFALNEFGCGYRKLSVHPKGTSTFLEKVLNL
jgi:hypothetical protein